MSQISTLSDTPSDAGMPPPSLPKGSTAICILGMHRSGTSALTRLLNLLGVELGQNLMPPAPDNPRGFWEHHGIVNCHTDLLNEIDSYYDDFFSLPVGWVDESRVKPHRDRLAGILKDEFTGKSLWGFKDPRACRLMGLWHGLLEEFGAEERCVLTVRDPVEVAASLAARGGEAWNKALLMCLEHMLAAERDTRGRRRVVVTYDQLMSEWRGTAGRICMTLGVRWAHDPESVAEEFGKFLDPALRHHDAAASTPEALYAQWGVDPRIAGWVLSAFRIFAGAANGAAIDQGALDIISAEYTEARKWLTGWRPLWSMNERYLQIAEWAKKMDAEMKRLTGDNQLLRMELAHRPAVLEAQARLNEAEIRLAEAEAKSAQLKARSDEALTRIAEAQAVALQSQARALGAEKTLENLRQSLSWEITGPLRAAGAAANRLFGKKPNQNHSQAPKS